MNWLKAIAVSILIIIPLFQLGHVVISLDGVMMAENCSIMTCEINSSCLEHCLAALSNPSDDAVIFTLFLLSVILPAIIRIFRGPEYERSFTEQIWHRPYYNFNTIVLRE